MSHQTDIDHAVNAVGLQACVNYMVEQYGISLLLIALQNAASLQSEKKHNDAWSFVETSLLHAQRFANEGRL